MSSVLVIAPHMDDEVLGCGGTIARHVASGDRVTVCVAANRAYGHAYDPAHIEREKAACARAREVLGYQELVFLDLLDEKLDQGLIDVIVPLEAVIERVRADVVYLPSDADLNQDHRAVFEATLVGCRPFAPHLVHTLRVYETPSSTDQRPAGAGRPFLPNYYVDVEATLAQKVSAMACYEAESRAFPHPRSPQGITALARKRGMEARMQAAEAFCVLRDGWW